MTEQPTRPTQSAPGSAPDYGPGGYLPERAARRARKIILREQMSANWPIAALVAGAVLAVTAALFVLTRTGPPGPPFEAVAEFDALAPRSVQRVPAGATGELLLLHTGSTVRVLEAPAEDVVWCAASGHVEGADGSVWNQAGQRVGGQAASLTAHPVEVHAGTVYVDPSTPRPPPPPAPGQVEPACG